MQEILLLLYDKPVFSNEKIKYIAKIRFIIHNMVETLIDIAFAMSMVSHFVKYLERNHFSTVDQILRYLACSLEKDIIFSGKSKLNFVWYVHSD